jgi:hypothetical protein
MKANSLRIGNLVSQNGFYGYVYSIESAEPRNDIRFSDKDIITLFDNGMTYVPIDEIEPIPLTEEWLIKFGFNKVCSMYIRISDINEMEFFDNIITFKDWFCKLEKKIQYVHQLQNLYFALTGEELKLLENV